MFVLGSCAQGSDGYRVREMLLCGGHTFNFWQTLSRCPRVRVRNAKTVCSRVDRLSLPLCVPSADKLKKNESMSSWLARPLSAPVTCSHGPFYRLGRSADIVVCWTCLKAHCLCAVVGRVLLLLPALLAVVL